MTLSPQLVEQIRQDYAAGLTQSYIASRYGVSQPTVHKKVKGVDPVIRPTTLLPKVYALASQGKTRREIATELGTNVTYVSRLCKRHGIKAVRQERQADKRGQSTLERNEAIRAMYESGHTLQEVGNRYGMTRERVRQIIRKLGSTAVWTAHQKKTAELRPIAIEVRRLWLAGEHLDAALDLHGMTYSELSRLLGPSTREQWKQHSWNRIHRYIDKQTEPHPLVGTPCWLWTGSVNPVTGYGRLTWLGENNISAHRFMYISYKGEPKQWVLHKCSVARCVNPDHLYDGTAKDNARDRDAIHERKERLPASAIDAIMSLKGSPIEEVAAAYNRHPTTIHKIWTGQVYKKFTATV